MNSLNRRINKIKDILTIISDISIQMNQMNQQVTNNNRRINCSPNQYSLEKKFTYLEYNVNLNTNKLKEYLANFNRLMYFLNLIVAEISNITDLIDNQQICYKIVDNTKFKRMIKAYDSRLLIDEKAYIIDCALLTTYNVTTVRKTNEIYIWELPGMAGMFTTDPVKIETMRKFRLQALEDRMKSKIIKKQLSGFGELEWDSFLRNIMSCKSIKKTIQYNKVIEKTNDYDVAFICPICLLMPASCKNSKFYYEPKDHIF